VLQNLIRVAADVLEKRSAAAAGAASLLHSPMPILSVANLLTDLTQGTSCLRLMAAVCTSRSASTHHVSLRCMLCARQNPHPKLPNRNLKLPGQGDPSADDGTPAQEGADEENTPPTAAGVGSMYNNLAKYCSLAADRLEHLGSDRFFDPELQKAWAMSSNRCFSIYI